MMVLGHHFLAFSFIFRLLLLLYQHGTVKASAKIEDVDLYGRVSKIEAKDLHQDGEISLLKNALDEERTNLTPRQLAIAIQIRHDRAQYDFDVSQHQGLEFLDVIYHARPPLPTLPACP